MSDARLGLGGAVRARAAPLLELPRREVAALAGLGLLALAGAGFAYVRARPLPALPAAVVASVSPSPGQPSGLVVVHVVGAVRRPGVYEVPAGARVRDAVARAGGLARTADAAAINLAREVVDGEQIVVPARGDPPPAAAAGGGGGGSGPGSGGKVNINLAGVAEFDTLPGIGPVIAQRIVEYRDSNGPFAAVRDLLKVPGIGPKKFASLEPYLTV